MGATAGKLDRPTATRQTRTGDNNVRVNDRANRRRGDREQMVRMGYVNCRGLKSKVDDIIEIAKGEGMHVVALTETHVREGEQELLELPEGYSFIGKGRGTGQRKGGGVGFLVRKDVRWHRIHVGIDEESEVKNEIEWMGMEAQRTKVAVGVVYMGREGLPDEWNDQIYEQLRTQVNMIQEQGYDVMITGDFNGHIGDGLDGIEGGDRDQNRNGKRLLNFSREEGFRIVNRDMQCKGKWTWSSGERQSIIDYVLVDNRMAQTVERCTIDEDGGMDIGSDHNFISLELKFEYQKVKDRGSKWVWAINKDTDWNSYKQRLHGELEGWHNAWGGEGVEHSVQDMADDLRRIIFGVARETVGRKRVPVDSKGYRMDSGLKGAIKDRRVKNRAWRLACKNRRDQEITVAKAEYMEARKRVIDMKVSRRAERNGEMTKKVMESGADASTVFWKQVVRRKKGGIHRLKHKGKTVTGRRDIEEALHDHWNEVNNPRWGEGEPPPSRREFRKDEWEQELCQKIERVEVEIAIDRIKAGKAPGPDGMLNEFIKKGPDLLWDSMVVIFNRVIEQREAPREWQDLHVNYIPKKGSVERLDQCRGIAISSNMGKIFARVMYMRLVRIVEREGFLGEIQNGFRPDRRVVDHVFTLSQILEIARKKRRRVFMAFLDVRKAYDRVWRGALWEKLEGLGFGGSFLSVMKALYQNIRCNLRVGEVDTDGAKLSIGLKQGCVLSPILFALYIRELGVELVNSGKGVRVGDEKIPGLFFADDIVLMADTREELQDLLKITGEYGNKWRLEFSEEKSQVMSLGQKHRQGHKWTVGNFNLPEGREKVIRIGEVDDYEYLGVRIKATGQGMFSHHIEKIKQKVNRTKGMIKITATNSFNRVFTGRVLWERVGIPGMLYGLDVIAVNQKDIEWLEKAQREMGKWLLGAPPCVGTEAVLGELGWLPVRECLAMRKLSYWGYLQSVDEHRWCRKAYLVALQEKTKWIQDIDKLADRYNLRGPEQIDQMWKGYVKGRVQKKFWEEWRSGVEEKSSLVAYRGRDKPAKSDIWDGSKGSKVLFQARAGVLNVEKRKQKWTSGSDGKCKVCNIGVDETIEHMVLWCSGYREKRERLFERWKRMDSQCNSLEQVRGFADNEGLAWVLGMRRGFPGSRMGIELVKGFLVDCWENRGCILEAGTGQMSRDGREG